MQLIKESSKIKCLMVKELFTSKMDLTMLEILKREMQKEKEFIFSEMAPIMRGASMIHYFQGEER